MCLNYYWSNLEFEFFRENTVRELMREPSIMVSFCEAVYSK